MSSGNGNTANVVLKGEELSIDGVQLAGGYTGEADLTPEIEDDSLQIVVNVRDFWLWPLALLIAGLLVVTKASNFKAIGTPGQGLRIRLRTMKEDVQRKHAENLQELKEVFTDATLPLAVSQKAGDELLFDTLERGQSRRG